MAHFTLACAAHNEVDLIVRTFPRAVRALTKSSQHTVDTVIVADRMKVDDIRRLIGLALEWDLTELRWRRDGTADFSGVPVNNFHARQFSPTDDYLITFTHDTFFQLLDPTFDVLDAAVQAFEKVPDAAVLCKVDDHEEWTRPLKFGASIPGVGIEVDRAVDQFLIYHNARFLLAMGPTEPWQRDRYSQRGEEEAWEDVVTLKLKSGQALIIQPDWPLVVKHSDLRLAAGSMHGTQELDVKLRVFESLVASDGRVKSGIRSDQLSLSDAE